LKKLCAKGEALLEGSRHSLESVGAITYKDIVYWRDRLNRLNYELSEEVHCVDKVVPPKILAQI
jgi:hypothetical protein